MTARRLGIDSVLVDHDAAREASRLLVNAICELADISLPEFLPAISLALKAFGLPPDFPDQVLVQELNFPGEA